MPNDRTRHKYETPRTDNASYTEVVVTLPDGYTLPTSFRIEITAVDRNGNRRPYWFSTVWRAD